MMCLGLIAVLVGSMLIAAPAFAADLPGAPGIPGATTVQQWKDGKKAVFFLAFDDACPTHRTKVIPELIKRNIPGTFYVIAGNDGLFGKQNWAELATNPNVIFGNHSFTHKDFPTVEHFEDEIIKATDAINAKVPQLPKDRLISFGKPGGVKYGISDAQIAEVLARHHLVLRPSFFSYPWGIKDTEHMHAYIEKTIKSGGMGHFDMHGVDGDWLSTPWDFFTDLLDTLEANRDQLWLTDALSYHKYLTERQTAAVKPLPGSNAERIELQLTSDADPKWYNLPLTLSTEVPAAWRKCRITQGTRTATVAVTDGRAMYDAMAGAEPIVLEAAR